MSAPSMKKFKQRLESFLAWLDAAGAEILTPTSEWEVLRFRGRKGVAIVYRDKYDSLTLQAEAAAAWNAFVSGTAYKANKPAVRKRQDRVVIETLLERDGLNCFFCQFPLGDDITKEHLLSVAHGGPSHISNLALAHRACNTQADTLSLPEKIRMHTEAVLAMRYLGRKPSSGIAAPPKKQERSWLTAKEIDEINEELGREMIGDDVDFGLENIGNK